jgi:hypothetical protein
MARHFQSWFRDQSIVIDGEDYDSCTFEGCTLIYRGGEPPSLSSNTFVGGSFELEDAALRTLGLFAVLNMAGMRSIVENWMKIALRTRVLPSAPERPHQ